MTQKKTKNTHQTRTMRRYQILMGVVGIIIIISMVISLLRF
jgi:hypothetical protein